MHGDFSEVVITAKVCENFCIVVSNQGDGFKTTRSKGVYAPMDFSIVTGWVRPLCSGHKFRTLAGLLGYHESD